MASTLLLMRILVLAFIGLVLSVPTPVSAQGSAPIVPQGTRAVGQDLELFSPTVLVVVGDRLVVADPEGDRLVIVIDRATGKVVSRIGRRGRGPGEFLDPRWIEAAEGKGRRFWVYDFQQRRLSLVDPDLPSERAVVETQELNNGTALMAPVRLEKGFISNGLFLDFTLVRLGQTGAIRERIALEPAFTREQIGHPTGWRHLNRTYLAADAARKRLALFYQYRNRLDIVDVESGRVSTHRGPTETRADFYVKDDRFFWRDATSQMAYTGVTASSSFIFGLHCGCRVGQNDRRAIHRFRWDGSFSAVIRMPEPARAIAAADDRTLYLLIEDPEPHILEIKLP